jgi:membrane-associated phospholipid phosphatase
MVGKLRELWRQHRERLALFALFILVEIVFYTIIGRLPRPAAVLATSLDNGIPFVPAVMLLYVLKPLLVFGALLMTYRNPTAYKRMAIGLIGVTLLSEVIFLVQPTLSPRPDVGGDGFADRLTAMVYALDGPANEFPSIHVSQSVFIMLYALTFTSQFVLPVVGFTAAMALSTLFVKQHTLLGLIGGILVGTLVFGYVKRKLPP